MLSLDLEWLAPVSLLRSDRWLEFYMQRDDCADAKKMWLLGQRAIADIQYYQVHTYRDEDRAAAFQRCFAQDESDYSSLDFLARVAGQILTWRGDAFEVKPECLELWSAFVAKVDPVWVLAASYASMIRKKILTPEQMAALQTSQSIAAFPREHGGKIFADNHVHMGGHGGSSLSLLDCSMHKRLPKFSKENWPAQSEFPLFSSGRDPNELPVLVNCLFHHLVNCLFSLEGNSSHSTFPNWEAPLLWPKGRPDSITMARQRGSSSDAQQLMLFALADDVGVDHRWLLSATALLIYDSDEHESALPRYALRAYIHACNIFRASMITTGSGLGAFVKNFGFFGRKPASNSSLNYNDYAFSSDSASHVLREFKVGPDKINRKFLAKSAIELIAKGRQDRCQYVFHFGRSGKSRADGYQEDYRTNLLNLVRDIQHELFSVEVQNYLLINRKSDAQRYLNLAQLVRGIDVAGNENDLPIEIFAPVIRLLRAPKFGNQSAFSSSLRQMHLSIHAGEDYSHLVSGLRSIDETVRFCDYHEGDRIGHGLAMGVDVGSWAQRQRRIYLPLQEYVDNLVWCHSQALRIIQKAPQFQAVIHVLENKIGRWAKQLYGEDVDIDALQKAWELRKNCPKLSRLESHAVGMEWEAMVPDMLYLNRGNDLKEGNEFKAIELWGRYTRIRGRNGNSVKTISLTIGDGHSLDDDSSEVITPLELELLTGIQDFMIEDFCRKGIIIEACPTSNVYIARLNEYREHPIFRWYPPCSDDLKPGAKSNRFGLRTGPIKVCVNTDDAGLMPTTIENEHRLLKIAAMARGDVCGDSADLWINRIREIGVEAFKSNHLDWSNENVGGTSGFM